MSADRRMVPRAKDKALHYWARWVRMSVARRVLVTLMTATAVGGMTFAACRGDDIAGPSSSTEQRPHLSSSGDTPHHPSKHKKMTQEEAESDPNFVSTVEVRFPVTEALYNTCRNELVVLNGELRRRLHIISNVENLMLKVMLQEWQHAQGVSGSAEYDHDGDPTTPAEVVRYQNQERLLDHFSVGPAQAPFKSDFQSRMHLIREGSDPLIPQAGDDLFVYVREMYHVDSNGHVVAKSEFRAECK